MRTIKYTSQFKRDYRREKRSNSKLDCALLPIIDLLARNKPLPPNKHDHALTGNWRDHRDCHISPDLILVYRKSDQSTLELVRLGTHSELSF